MMRKQALRASSTHNVCVFCATRFNSGSFLDTTLHSLPLSSAFSAPAAPVTTRYLQQRRGISSSRPSPQNFGNGAPQSQLRNHVSAADAERDAIQNRFAKPAVQQQQQQSPPQQRQLSARSDAENALLKATFDRLSPPPSHLAQSAQSSRYSNSRGSPITHLGRRDQGTTQDQHHKRQQQQGVAGGRGFTGTSSYNVRVERAQQLRSQQRGEDLGGFDKAKVEQWQHALTPKGRILPQQVQRQQQQQQGQYARTRQEGDKSFVPLSSEQSHARRMNLLSRMNNNPSGSGAAAGAVQEQTRPQNFVRPEQAQARSVPPSTGDPEKDALRVLWGTGAPASQGSSFSKPEPRVEHNHLLGAFPKLEVASQEAPAQAPEQEQEQEQVQEVKETQPPELGQGEPTVQNVQERERPTRFSKFADIEEDEAPRKRKARGGRSKALEEEEDVDFNRIERRKSKKKDKKKKRVAEVAPPTPIYLPEYLSVVSLANMLRVRTEDLVRKMEELGYEDINNDDILNAENAGLIAMEYNFEPAAANPADDLDLYPAPEPEDMTIFPPRPPVVTIMGHVDHGKTTLLDYLRKSSVAATEFGGITQHIGAFSVPLSNDKTITFLDTPGHAAFLNMRQRGANVTDIVILVVAADDSVKPQTLEAIKHAKAARVPIIVAINKIDKEGANPERVKQDLARHGVDVEDFGGDIQAIPVSGKTGEGMQDLEEAAITLSEILDHRADPEGPVEGWVLEATTKKSGKVATVLVRRGTLRVGSIIVAGQTFARVRSIKNEAGVDIPTVGPGMPAEIDGWRGQPEAGDEVLEAPDEQRAAEVVEYREANADRVQMAKDMEAINEARRLEHEKREREEALAAAAEAGEADPAAAVAAAEKARLEASTGGPMEVPFVVKADVSGSVEAVVDYVMTVGNGEVRPRVLRTGIGPVSESDVELAATAGGHVVAFNTTLDSRMARVAETKGVRVLEQNVIYRLVDDVKALLSEQLAPTVVQRVTGEASVLEVFEVSLGKKRMMSIAGCRVTNGLVNRGGKVRVFRNEEKVYEGSISSLKQVKKDVTEMRKGNECGMAFENWGEFKAGDTIQCYEEKFEKRTL
ncbi:Mitochondrial translation initiation protein [Lasiodiplodia theobromae]|uniref:Mitochondrial translation initiation protein n=1 Tax=Lasiodiplodia theobromae TaxID=45133 RepID=UPI0015C354A8|nr:Mitochondrial translation initiation protein [Lasiodiplodia theobromae]KAF4538073.1 Mitochondrial translation initiation protein [Lasiodiplodia theobromae]